jgi:protoporphyrin/coproporphyrin ferrochelatase
MIGVLLLNLGSPASPSPADVGAYLREFLMDEYVIDMPKPLRWALVNLAIVPRRKYVSAKLYQSIWTDQGSPLLTHTHALAERLQQALGGDFKVAVGMRYGEPSTTKALSHLIAQGAERFIALPLYPQYAESSFETAVQAVKRAATALGCADQLEIMPPFYNAPGYLDAAAAQVRQHLTEHPNAHLVFSYHSLPEQHVKRLDSSGQHCLQRMDCCEQIGTHNALCYRAHCVATTRAIAERLNLLPQQYSLAFQSRLGRQAWLGPQTEAVLPQLVQRGIRHVAVTCPSFVADCLETLEEIAVRARQAFLQAGGSELTLVPALNADAIWVAALAQLVRTQVELR